MGRDHTDFWFKYKLIVKGFSKFALINKNKMQNFYRFMSSASPAKGTA